MTQDATPTPEEISVVEARSTLNIVHHMHTNSVYGGGVVRLKAEDYIELAERSNNLLGGYNRLYSNLKEYEKKGSLEEIDVIIRRANILTQYIDSLPEPVAVAWRKHLEKMDAL